MLAHWCAASPDDGDCMPGWGDTSTQEVEFAPEEAADPCPVVWYGWVRSGEAPMGPISRVIPSIPGCSKRDTWHPVKSCGIAGNGVNCARFELVLVLVEEP